MNNIGLIIRQPHRSLPPMWKVTADEPYYIRRFKPTHKRDCDTVYLMDLQPAVNNMPNAVDDQGEELEYEQMLSYRDDFGPHSAKIRNTLFAVTDRKSRAIGWVWYYQDQTNPLPSRVIKSLKLPASTIFLEISYQKLGTDFPQGALDGIKTITHQFLRHNRKGVAVSGVRQTLHYLKAKAGQNTILVYAFTDLDNIPSAKVLERNNFVRCQHIIKSNGDKLNFWYKVL